MYLIDTNILLRAQRGQGSIADNAIKILESQGYVLGIVPQNIAEFWNVCTRPADRNGLGYTTRVTAQKLQDLQNAFTLFTANELDIYLQWQRLVKQYEVKGSRVHDTRLVAAMLVHGLTHILTFNVKDFQRFREITAVHPEEVKSRPST